MRDFEKLGVFYLGRLYDLARRRLDAQPLLYDSRDLTTHAVCVGMTGSGKTGLCLSLLEEAAIDGVPAICIDPKGDLGNLLLTFPDLRGEDFLPWIDREAAARAGLEPEAFAEKTAQTWREGLAAWGQDGQRIARFRDAADAAIYTPGSRSGLPLSAMSGFAAPPPEVLADGSLLRQRLVTATSSLLALLGIEADPVQSREHILLSHLLEHAWRAGQGVGLEELVRGTQDPPFTRVGILDLETFFPEKDRRQLALRLNNLLASPSMAAWREGEPLDIDRLLFTEEGRPRLSIVSIAHLSDSERMFFVALLLNELLTWMRRQPGTSSLRAILYMDEVYGYFPPTANPPSKPPMLTLLKQARAYGVGVVLATQNPVDLDYKGLSNAGTWFLGRLQTERDKQRVIEGLQGASAASGAWMDRQQIEAALAGLGKRVFLMNNVHDDRPVAFQTRWALSYLRGPLTGQQIARLMADRKRASATEAGESELVGKQAASQSAATGRGFAAGGATAEATKKSAVLAAEQAPEEAAPAKIPPEIEQRWLPPVNDARQRVVSYRPWLLGRGKLRFVRKGLGLDFATEAIWLAPVAADDGAAAFQKMASGGVPDVWRAAQRLKTEPPEWTAEPPDGARAEAVPDVLGRAAAYKSWRRLLVDHLYRSERVAVLRSKRWRLVSRPEQSRAEFVVRLRHMARQQRDAAMERLENKYARRFATLKRRIESAKEQANVEQDEYRQATFDTVVSVGGSLLEAVLGRRLLSRTNVRRAATSSRRVRRALRQRADVEAAQRKLETLKQQLEALEQAFEEEAAELAERYRVDADEVETLEIAPLKKEIATAPLILMWMPHAAENTNVAGTAS